MESKKYKLIIAALCILLIISCITIFYLLRENSIEDFIPLDDAFGLSNIAQSEIDNKTKQEYLGTINDALTDARGKNLYLNVQDGDDTYVTMIYNKKGEAFAQASSTGYITVYRNDHKAIRYTDYIDYGYDSDVLSLLEFAYQLALDGMADVFDVAEDDKIEDYIQPIIDVKGWEGISKLYSMLDNEFSDLMVEQLKTAILAASATENSGISENDEANFRFIYAISKDNILESAACYVYFGNIDGKDITWKDLSSSWGFVECLDVYDWELDNYWYNTDWSNINEWEDLTEAEDKLSNQYTDVMNMLNAYARDNGYDTVEYDEHIDNDMDRTENVENPVTDTNDNYHIHEDGSIHYE